MTDTARNTNPGQSPDAEAVFAEIRSSLGTDEVPVFYEAMAIFPAYLATSWQRYRTVLADGEVDRDVKELVALATAVAQACDPVIGFQRAQLARQGVPEESVVEALAACDFFEGFDTFAHALHIDSELRPRRMMAGDMSLVDKEIDVNVPYIIQSEDPTVSRVYGEIKETFGIPFIPNIFKALAHCPSALEAKWEAYKAIMLGGRLPQLTKELVAVAVSAVNACYY